MPFPFLPGGLLLALSVLGGALAIFGVLLHLLDKAASSARGSIAAGLEAGLRTWSHDRSGQARSGSSSAGELELRPFRLVGVEPRPGPSGTESELLNDQAANSRAAVQVRPAIEDVDGGVATQRVRRHTS